MIDLKRDILVTLEKHKDVPTTIELENIVIQQEPRLPHLFQSLTYHQAMVFISSWRGIFSVRVGFGGDLSKQGQSTQQWEPAIRNSLLLVPQIM